jgi:hypothetical protein
MVGSHNEDNSMVYENGQIVMFTTFMEEGDEEARFIVIEDRDSRILVEEICDLPFAPQRVFQKDEITLALEQDLKQRGQRPSFA